MTHRRKNAGFSFIELLLSVAILVVLSALAAPMFGDSEALQVDVVSRLLVSDLEHAQILAITHPEDEIALVVEDDGSGWRIVSLVDPLTPLLDSATGEPLLVEFGKGAARSAQLVNIETTALFNTIAYDQNGGLTDFTQNVDCTMTCGKTK